MFWESVGQTLVSLILLLIVLPVLVISVVVTALYAWRFHN